MTDHTDVRLYGGPGDETLYLDVITYYEQAVDPWLDPEKPPHLLPTRTIEVHDVRPPVDHLPTADAIAGWISEWASENGELDEDASEWLDDICEEQSVKDACEIVRLLIASKVTYYMANEVVATHVLHWDTDGQPTIDGQPLYREAADG